MGEEEKGWAYEREENLGILWKEAIGWVGDVSEGGRRRGHDLRRGRRSGGGVGGRLRETMTAPKPFHKRDRALWRRPPKDVKAVATS